MAEARRPRRAATGRGYGHSVFINCPFDTEYRPIFNALVFAIYACGFYPRCALEEAGSGTVRLEKIVEIIRECQFGVHDICRTETNSEGLPRFNMPFELGLFMGAQRLGTGRQGNKRCLILDHEQYRYQKFLSDISGQDPKAHGGNREAAIRAVRDWLAAEVRNRGDEPLAGATEILSRFAAFEKDVEKLAKRHMLDDEAGRTFADTAALISIWLQRFLPSKTSRPPAKKQTRRAPARR